MKFFSKLIFLIFVFAICVYLHAEQLVIDDFESGAGNKLGGRTSVYQKEPSRAIAITTGNVFYGQSGKALMIKYDKKGSGGPYGKGGWCGYYTLLKQGNQYFDASKYKAITFYVRGENGGENFVVGTADKHWDMLGDSVKSRPIGEYLELGKITTDWQKAIIPLEEFFIDHKQFSAISICFENDLYPGGEARGTIYIDSLSFE